MPEPTLVLDSVVREYPGSPPVRAVDGVSLVVSAGELVAVVGPSGSGKSTLLHLMGALDTPTSGSVSIAGRDIADLDVRALSGLRARSLGFVFQEFFLIEGLTALENVAQGLLYRGTPAPERLERASRALARVGLDARSGHTPSRLSGGERQRVAIARALVGDPELVLADEPTGNLDSVTAAGIADLLLELNADGSTIVVITHDHEFARRFPRNVRLRDGRIAS